MNNNEKIRLIVERPRPPPHTPDDNPPISPRDYESYDETKLKNKKSFV